MTPTSNFRNVWPLERKFQYGRQSLGLVTPTFFSMGDDSKLLFSIMGFSYLATRNNNFRHPGGPGALLAYFRTKSAIFETFSMKIQVFQLFKSCF